jgi:hypothetical protein
MCWYCDHPDGSPLEYLDQIREVIDRCGWAVQGVERDRVRPPWAYTVGLSAASRPELVVTGLPLTRAVELLNGVAAHLMHATAPEPGEQMRLRGGPLIEIVEVAEPAAHLLIAAELYGAVVQARQVVHADDRGRWPWEVGWRGVRGGQPVLGVRAAPVGQGN